MEIKFIRSLTVDEATRKSIMNLNETTGALTLKIKAMSLQDEAKYILRLERRIKRNKARAKSEEHKAEHSVRLGTIQDHRRREIRREARSTHLARMMIKGTAYQLVEGPTTRTKPDWTRVSTLLASHLKEDSRVVIQRVKSWAESGEAAKKDVLADRRVAT